MALHAIIALLSAAQLVAGVATGYYAVARPDVVAMRGLWVSVAVVMLASGASIALLDRFVVETQLSGAWEVLTSLVPAFAIAAALCLVAVVVRAGARTSDRKDSPLSVENEQLLERAMSASHALASSTSEWRSRVDREIERVDAAREIREMIETAVKISNITVGFQDRDLRYRWIINSNFDVEDADIVSLDDSQLTTQAAAATLTEHKRRAIESGRTETFELELHKGEESEWYRFDTGPIEVNGEAIGIVTTAIDITRAKRLDKMRTDLSRRLAETLQRLNLALKSGRILVFSQDLDLRYSWVNTTDSPIRVVVGKSDAEIFPEAIALEMIRLKRDVIDTRSPTSGEFRLGEGSEQRWYDLHIEPNLSSTGDVIGLTCAAIDITHRVRNEEHMRLVMRELTHRTKNLLAVAIAIARQTAFKSPSVDTFVQALSARLRALATAQDLIVAGDWVGVDMEKLIRHQLEQLVRDPGRITLVGPQVTLSPEATQNFGLALHELAANAARYGALSTPGGTVRISWEIIEKHDAGNLLKLDWAEHGGPTVSPPSNRGFGLNVIERNLARSLKADVELKFEEPGFAMSMALPMQHITSQEAARLQPLQTA